MTHRWKPSVTVAAVIERNGRFLLVEEHTPEGLMLNNPAGHLDPSESLVDAVVRETLEETMHGFTPTALVGAYMARFRRPLADGTVDDITYLRFAFCGSLGAIVAGRSLDHGIERTLWMTPDELRACPQRHRSPMLMRCVDDYTRGQRFALDTMYTDPSVYANA